MEATRAAAGLATVDYEDLYARWEDGNWSAMRIDLRADAREWHDTLDEMGRRATLWNCALFLHGEDVVAETLAPFVGAAPRDEQKRFLATQQVDEARHAVFFGRFMRDVVECGDTHDAVIAATRSELTWGFRQVFDELERTADELRRKPSRPLLARGVMLYHLIIEASLAQPGQHFLERSLTDRQVLPGLLAGMENISRDEQRHIGFGVKLLSELIVDPECRAAALEVLADVLPHSIAVLVPPGFDRRYTEALGFTLEEIYAEAERSLTTKLRVAGFSEAEVNGPLRITPDLTPEQRAAGMLTLLEAGVLGEKTGAPSTDPVVMRTFFDGLAASLDPARAPHQPLTIQWEFEDAQPWLVHVENGSTRAEQGRVEAADLAFRCRFEDWVDAAVGRVDVRSQFLRRRVRPSSLGMLWRCRRLFDPAA